MRCGLCNQWEEKDGQAWCPHVEDFVDEFDVPEGLECDQFGIGKKRPFPVKELPEEEYADEECFEDDGEEAEEVEEVTPVGDFYEDNKPEDAEQTEGVEPVEEELEPIEQIREQLYETGASLEDALARVKLCLNIIEEKIAPSPPEETE